MKFEKYSLPDLSPLFRQHQICAPFDIAPVEGGGNNRIFKVSSADRVVLLKQYFRHPGDPRDRLGHDFGFCKFAWDSGIRCVPEPIGCDKVNNVALFEFVAGNGFSSDNLSDENVEFAGAFIRLLNRSRESSAAQALPDAAEAHFSVRGQLAATEARLRRLTAIVATDALNEKALAFVQGQLAPTYLRICEWVTHSFQQAHMATDDVLPQAFRCLSPSDFGFHNALLTPRGEIKFFDFEYAGWDDPAKLICDFFCQPRIPIPLHHFDRFVTVLSDLTGEQDSLTLRAKTLLPVHQLKWCLIRLNDFLPGGLSARNFALQNYDPMTRRTLQLTKAKAAFDSMVALHGWLR